MASSRPALAPQPRLDILAFGDSLVAGYRLPRDAGFAPQLEATLRGAGLDAHVINAGISGNTAAAARARLPRILDGLPRTPDLIIVALGGNDILRGIAPARTRADMEAILELLGARGIPVVLAGMIAPFFLGPAYATAFNAIYPELAARHRAALYPFFLAGVAGDPRLNLADRVHPNAAGIERMVKGIAPIVLRTIEAQLSRSRSRGRN
jgi:acyl-CoA thioesterase-1